MEAMRESWTDERLDDLSHRSDDGFKRVEADLRAKRSETKTEFALLRAEMNTRFDSMQRMIIQGGGGIIASILLYVLTSHL